MRSLLHLALAALAIANLLAVRAAADDAGPAGPYALVQSENGPVRAPLFSAAFANTKVAQIDDRVVTLQDLTDALSASHLARGPDGRGGKKDVTPVLDRLIATQLIILEAHEMGIDELPAVKTAVASFEDSAAREVLKERLTAKVKPEAAEVERAGTEASREWKIRSLLFPVQGDAKKAVAQAKRGTPFEAIAKKAAAAKQATFGGEAQFISAKSKPLAQVLTAVRDMQPGHLSAPVRVPEGWVLIQLDEIRSVPDAAARESAEEESVQRQREEVLRDYYGTLMKNVQIDQKLFDALDFEAKTPGFAALAKDSRVLARIDGAPPVLVSDLAHELQLTFFHGIDAAIAEKKVQAEKLPVFNAHLYKLVFTAAARREHVEKSPEYAKMVSDYRDSMIFGAFVQTAIVPELKIRETEGQAYYEAHKADFTVPEFFTLQSLSFATPQAAQSAAEKLRAGTDFGWLKANANGQLAEGQRTVQFEGNTVSVTSLDKEVAKALAGAKSGEVRVANVSAQESLLVVVKHETPPVPQPYVQAREVIAKKVTAERLTQAITDWAAKLRKAHAVKIFLTQIVS